MKNGHSKIEKQSGSLIKVKSISELHSAILLTCISDLYKSDWKLQGNTNTQLKSLCRASYTDN